MMTGLILSLSGLTACSDENEDNEDNTLPSSITITNIDNKATAEGDTSNTGGDDNDIPANSAFTKQVSTALNGTSATVTNSYSSKGVVISQNGADIVITSSIAEVEYILSGTTSNGSVKIYSDKKFKLTLNGVAITSDDGSAINIQSKKRVFVSIADNTTNTLTDAASYTATADEDAKAALFSEGQLIFYGGGALTINGKYKHAICNDHYVRIISGTITINSSSSDGIHTNDAFIMDGGNANSRVTSVGRSTVPGGGR